MVTSHHPYDEQAMCRHLNDAVLMKTSKKGGSKKFKEEIAKACMHATADQKVAILKVMLDFTSKSPGPTRIALARIIPKERRRPAVEKQLLVSRRKFSRVDIDAINACSSKRPWWKVLGVSPDCDASHVRKAFRAGAQVTHPDQGGTKEAFCEMYAAYEKALLERHEHPLGPSWSPDAFANDAYSVDIPV